MAVIVNEGLR